MVTSLEKDHVFPYVIEKYVKYEYERDVVLPLDAAGPVPLVRAPGRLAHDDPRDAAGVALTADAPGSMLDASQLASLDFGQGNACTPEEYLFLGALVRLVAPRSIVEIGTSTGIGTLVMAAALAEAAPTRPPPMGRDRHDRPAARPRHVRRGPGAESRRDRAARARASPASSTTGSASRTRCSTR